MKTMLLILILFLSAPAFGQSLLDPAKVSVTGPKGSTIQRALRDELRKSGRVAIVTKGADWQIFLDAVPLEEINQCQGYAVAVYAVSGKQRQLTAYAGISIEAVAKAIAQRLDVECFKGK